MLNYLFFSSKREGTAFYILLIIGWMWILIIFDLYLPHKSISRHSFETRYVIFQARLPFAKIIKMVKFVE